MAKNWVINNQFTSDTDHIKSFVQNFNHSGQQLGKGDRNVIKLFDLRGTIINIKCFKIPNIFNRFIYRFFRKSKAQRSYEYANKLRNLHIGTPEPIAYFEETSAFMFGRSFYISEQIDCDLTYRELTHNLDYPDHEMILRAFTRFTYELHEKQINFLDHSPGNTLIKKTNTGYDFYLVDLNRMKFGPMDFRTRINNFKRLTIHESMVAVMSDEYANCSGEDPKKIFDLMWQLTQEFQEKFHRKKRLKKRLKFWK